MKNAYELRKYMDLKNYSTEITREDFGKLFTKTKEKVTFTFQGWDGKSYAGESRTAYVYRCTEPGFEGHRFIKVGKHVHYVMDGTSVLEQATGKFHETVSWLVDVQMRRKEG